MDVPVVSNLTGGSLAEVAVIYLVAFIILLQTYAMMHDSEKTRDPVRVHACVCVCALRLHTTAKEKHFYG